MNCSARNSSYIQDLRQTYGKFQICRTKHAQFLALAKGLTFTRYFIDWLRNVNYSDYIRQRSGRQRRRSAATNFIGYL